MQQISVAVADTDSERRAGYERFLQSQPGLKLLANVASSHEASNGRAFVSRRLNPRTDVTANENEVARIKRLKPLVLLVNMNLCGDEDIALLLSLRHECPGVLMILLADDSVNENQMIGALEIGARGYLKSETVQHHLTRAIQVIGRGEVWVPRKVLGNIMDRMLH
jgi:DNA-binding NarL/FixJ family response regulator